MRKMMVAGNWKMNTTLAEGIALAEALAAQMPPLPANKQVVLCPPYTHLSIVANFVQPDNNFYMGAQNCHQAPSGAYTGEVSADMLVSVGATHVILGHSERRQYQNETDALLKEKVDAALSLGLQIIFCCGESLETRDAGDQNGFVSTQLAASLFHLNAAQLQNVCIAYEPIWAIGTGRTASSAQAQDMHAHIRGLLNEQYGAEVAGNMSILYGGSCKASNAQELFNCPDVDGGLIGGAALKAEDFMPIIQAMMAV